MTQVLLALGSNLGEREANLRRAVAELDSRGVTVTQRSGIWETPPVPPGQPVFLNAAVAANTTLSPHELLDMLKAIEYALGRRPGPRWGPRPVDIDILFYGSECINEPDLVIPHPRIAERAFVLAPLMEIATEPLPVLEKTAADLLDAIGLQGAQRTYEEL